MNKTEMVSVPRETLERIIACGKTGFPVTDVAFALLREILDMPAEQHQGEPVAFVDSGCLRNLRVSGFDSFSALLHREQASMVSPQRVALYTHPAPAVQKSEPAQPAFTMPSSENSYGFGYVDGTCIQSLRGYRDHLEEIVDSIPEGPLYTRRAADAGEVERLREENRVLQKQLGERWSDIDALNKSNEEYSAAAVDSGMQNDALRAQLAERDALLAETRTLLHSVTALGGVKIGTLYSHALHMGHRITAALSASAEPSAREAEALAAEKALGIERLPAEPSAPKCEACNDQGLVGNIIDTVPCPDCAPVERDERAEFDLEHERLWPFPSQYGPATQSDHRQRKALRFEGWQARAALERKS